MNDEVAHKTADSAGVVVAIYAEQGTTYLDVREDDHIHYKTPEANWDVVAAADE